MKAIIHTTYGPPQLLQLKEIEQPLPGPNDLLIKVRAASVSRTECHNLTGQPAVMRLTNGLTKPRKAILGIDFAGVVEAVGALVTRFKTGDRVFGFDDGILGSYAEYMTIDERNAVETIPDSIAFDEMAAMLEGAHYAINFINKTSLQKGQRVLVNGSTGAIGSALVQLCIHQGAVVTAVCRAAHFDLMHQLGVDRCIDYEKEDFTFDTAVYDFVFDSVGKSTFAQCRCILAPKGVYISSELGPYVQNPFLALITPLSGGQRVKFPIPVNRQASMQLIARLAAEGHFKAIIDRHYPMDAITEAFKYVMTGQKVGAVILKVDSKDE